MKGWAAAKGSGLGGCGEDGAELAGGEGV